MGEVRHIDEARPHVSGPVLCFRCEHEWVAVRPVGTFPMECPSCGAMMGYSWSNVRFAFRDVLGDECCEQKDSTGTCCAPACIFGSAMKLATLVHRLGIMDGREDD
jgi:hypothetical protein